MLCSLCQQWVGRETPRPFPRSPLVFESAVVNTDPEEANELKRDHCKKKSHMLILELDRVLGDLGGGAFTESRKVCSNPSLQKGCVPSTSPTRVEQ